MIPKPRFRWPKPRPLTTDDAKGLATAASVAAAAATAASAVQSIVAGANITVDDTDPQNPVVSATGGGGVSAPSSTKWRLLVYKNANTGTDTYSLIAEVGMFSVVGGPNLCTGGTATANATSATSSPANAFDGNPATYWASPPANPAPTLASPNWLQYEFMAPVTVRAVSLTSRSSVNTKCIAGAFLQYYDGSTWQYVFDINDSAAWGNLETRTYAAAAATRVA